MQDNIYLRAVTTCNCRASVILNKVREKMFIFNKILDNEHLMHFEQCPLIRIFPPDFLDTSWAATQRAYRTEYSFIGKEESIVLVKVKESLSRFVRETKTVAYTVTVKQKYHGAILDNVTAIYFYYHSERKSIDSFL